MHADQINKFGRAGTDRPPRKPRPALSFSTRPRAARAIARWPLARGDNCDASTSHMSRWATSALIDFLESRETVDIRRAHAEGSGDVRDRGLPVPDFAEQSSAVTRIRSRTSVSMCAITSVIASSTFCLSFGGDRDRDAPLCTLGRRRNFVHLVAALAEPLAIPKCIKAGQEQQG